MGYRKSGEGRKKMIVISGVNLIEGGPLSIYYDCLDAIIESHSNITNDVVAFVHSRELFAKYEQKVKIIELPKAKKNYLYRLYYEYIYFWNYSKTKNIDIWISLHDITPRVLAGKLYTYCHNASPFMDKNLSNIKYSLKNVAFAYFYKYLYRINIKSASAIIVQQDWMRRAFLKMFPVQDIIVSYPDVKTEIALEPRKCESEKTIFIYPAFPRFFKNFEVICQAARILEKENIEVWFTIDGTENRYSSDLYKNYANINSIKWLGLQPREKLFELYNQSDCLIFPSKLETWGLPITEFKLYKKPIILADRPYAHETLGKYDYAIFFDESNPTDLAECMIRQIYKKDYDKVEAPKIYPKPLIGWRELLGKLLDEE
ncbi:MAG: glycosyltransferase [Clostridiales bacterium]|nr:glycosyltransferase [Clostridiales bacterium]